MVVRCGVGLFFAVWFVLCGFWCLRLGGIFSLNCCTVSFLMFVCPWFFPCFCFLCSFVLRIDNIVY